MNEKDQSENPRADERRVNPPEATRCPCGYSNGGAFSVCPNCKKPQHPPWVTAMSTDSTPTVSRLFLEAQKALERK